MFYYVSVLVFKNSLWVSYDDSVHEFEFLRAIRLQVTPFVKTFLSASRAKCIISIKLIFALVQAAQVFKDLTYLSSIQVVVAEKWYYNHVEGC